MKRGGETVFCIALTESLSGEWVTVVKMAAVAKRPINSFFLFLCGCVDRAGRDVDKSSLFPRGRTLRHTDFLSLSVCLSLSLSVSLCLCQSLSVSVCVSVSPSSFLCGDVHEFIRAMNVMNAIACRCHRNMRWLENKHETLALFACHVEYKRVSLKFPESHRGITVGSKLISVLL